MPSKRRYAFDDRLKKTQCVICHFSVVTSSTTATITCRAAGVLRSPPDVRVSAGQSDQLWRTVDERTTNDPYVSVKTDDNRCSEIFDERSITRIPHVIFAQRKQSHTAWIIIRKKTVRGDLYFFSRGWLHCRGRSTERDAAALPGSVPGASSRPFLPDRISDRVLQGMMEYFFFPHYGYWSLSSERYVSIFMYYLLTLDESKLNAPRRNEKQQHTSQCKTWIDFKIRRYVQSNIVAKFRDRRVYLFIILCYFYLRVSLKIKSAITYIRVIIYENVATPHEDAGPYYWFLSLADGVIFVWRPSSSVVCKKQLLTIKDRLILKYFVKREITNINWLNNT